MRHNQTIYTHTHIDTKSDSKIIQKNNASLALSFSLCRSFPLLLLSAAACRLCFKLKTIVSCPSTFDCLGLCSFCCSFISKFKSEIVKPNPKGDKKEKDRNQMLRACGI